MEWYTERYDPKGIRAKSHRTFPSFEEAIDDAQAALATGELPRAMAAAYETLRQGRGLCRSALSAWRVRFDEFFLAYGCRKSDNGCERMHSVYVGLLGHLYGLPQSEQLR